MSLQLLRTLSADAGGRVDGVDVLDNLLLVATSNLGGNVWDSSLHVVNTNTLKRIASVKKSCGSADVCWLGNGQRAACADDNGDVKLFKVEKMPSQLVETTSFSEHDDIVSCVAAAAQGHGNFILSGSHDRSIKLWDIGSDKNVSVGTWTGHSNAVTSVAWKAGKEQEFASASIDCSIRLWDIRQPEHRCSCHRLDVPALTLSWDLLSDTVLAVGCEDGSVVVLDYRMLSTSVSFQRVHKGRVNRVRSSQPSAGVSGGQDSSLLASVGDDGVLAIHRLSDGSCHHKCALHSDYVRAVAWNGGGRLITGGWDRALHAVQVMTVEL